MQLKGRDLFENSSSSVTDIVIYVAWIVPLIAAALAAASVDKAQCGDVADVAETNPTCKRTGIPSRFEPLAFNSSKWIWTGENLTPGGNNPAGLRGFRKNITSACGKCATCATIIAASDDAHFVYVNGKLIGSGGGWTTGQVFFTALEPSSNLIAIAGNNVQGPAGVFATIRIHYSDGSQETFITDESWKTLRGVAPPNNFAVPSFGDGAWPTASAQGIWEQSLWGKPSLPPVLPLSQSKWIWTSDNHNTVAPKGARAFRKTVNNCTKRAVCATALIAVDDEYTFYVNGQVVGRGIDRYRVADAWTIPNLRPVYNTFAVNASNRDGPAGLIATVIITYSDGTNATIVTDGSWKAVKTIPHGFEETFTDDSDWDAATVVGNYGIAPWGQLTIPTT